MTWATITATSDKADPCPRCLKPVSKGQEIVRVDKLLRGPADPPIPGRWVHAGCEPAVLSFHLHVYLRAVYRPRDDPWRMVVLLVTLSADRAEIIGDVTDAGLVDADAARLVGEFRDGRRYGLFVPAGPARDGGECEWRAYMVGESEVDAYRGAAVLRPLA